MPPERRPGSLTGLADDSLGTIAVSLAVDELRWTPDVAPAVIDRIARDATAYPEQFDRRPSGSLTPLPSAPGGPSARRAVGRIAVFVVILAIIAMLVVVAATANAAASLEPGTGLLSVVMPAS